MGFYLELSRRYDEIFPVDAGEMRFVAGLLAGRDTLLDIGCGTGNKTVLLSDTARITGMDGDAGMIGRARHDNARPGIVYEVADMAALATRFPPASFDGAVCLGNTLVHLTTAEALQSLCGAVHRLLVPGGLFVCQILNYDRILDNNITELPVLESSTTRLSRRYSRKGDLLLFETEIFLKDTGHALCNKTPLYPLRPAALAAMLSRAGFSGREQYGSYQGGPFADDSFILIATAVA